ncbi:MAG: hypothetical protein ACREGR_01065 [Minisyncoccia bacterium]
MARPDFSRPGQEWLDYRWRETHFRPLWGRCQATRSVGDLADLYRIVSETHAMPVDEATAHVTPLLEAMRPDGTFPLGRKDETDPAQAAGILARFECLGQSVRCLLTTRTEIMAVPDWVPPERHEVFENECGRWGSQAAAMRASLDARLTAYFDLPLTFGVGVCSWGHRLLIDAWRIADGFAWDEKRLALMNAAFKFYERRGTIAPVGFERSTAFLRAGAIGTYLALAAWGDRENAEKCHDLFTLLGKALPIGELGDIWNEGLNGRPSERVEVLLASPTLQ